MKIKDITTREWIMIFVAVLLLILTVISWDRISSRISDVWNIYTDSQK